MAPTRIADVIVPEVFNPYVSVRTTQLSRLWRSGLVATNQELNALASAGGKLINMPFWEDLTGDDENLSDTTALTPQNIEAGQDVAALLLRGKAWAANDLAGALAGSDPMREIGNKVAEFWVRAQQKTLVSLLNGIFGAGGTLNASNRHDISGELGAAAVLGPEGYIDAVQKLGDHKDNVTAVFMHSAVEAHLAKLDLIEYERGSQGEILVRRYLGHEVIIDDNLTPTAGVYDSYIFGPGAIGYGEGSPAYPTETDRDKLAGDDILINRRHFLLHPRGVAFQNVSVAGVAPTNAELAANANWGRVYDPKLIRIVQFRYRLVAAA